ncbi:M20/M25/M40 family metallo-hydrolase [Novosphingobium sp.]|jgi:acetylornithine deacetylase/succinyl-diaminopimelate desuccinylase-like protein|uniref:M20/M25/M40 family metallo-hydrolase n=1 Tax=Novosphingobium sp. TaxID=1874826 RepID=UPI0022CC9C2E|nr:M20/M25/M40 family metallo-hydrolase [Novosphingobium sp.]MCZ8019233.1 M20/M25/M40 family metallo-hydrolase [Novosphingobium sp.]MCZ8035041.1 M20/M25/M40 family metallo-hydrolase [Novosphingobium sp.]MCZ8052609.1 M20/M25/M40 family metallo-hydrolase [Novosphingobium sp.]MCZ8058708.1 M20/M25/M40 family metallo-hydrolase [Novosphingobium sp.]MCZ8233105.1 M20/M25/M40 family metallo-hydrolase [Novosphingobium sp.]
MLRAAMTLAEAALVTFSAPALAQQTQLRPDQLAFRELYQELVETNTTLSEGDCTLAAQRMAARLKAAGMQDSQLTVFFPPDKPREGGLVAVWPGTSKTLKPLLLLAHIDVVEAKRSDWTRDPFKLVEEDGYFFARGVSDNKAQAAIWTDILVRMAKAGERPKRTIKVALTCGEETVGAFNGAEWLTKERRELIDAEFAFNEGGGGRTSGTALAKGGKLVSQSIQIGEKAYQDFILTATNPGGHSSQPVRENAIYAMSDALARLRDYTFPTEFSDVTRLFLARSGPMYGGDLGAAMVALANNPNDAAAEAVVRRDRMLNSLLGTTCVATLIEGGHAPNALPQTVKANVNCRMYPGRTAEETRAQIVAAIANPAIKVERRDEGRPIAKQPPLDPRIMGPAERLVAKHFPGVPLLPAMATGATDAVHTGAAGIPTYGVPGLWRDTDNNNTHGLNERLEVLALYRGRDFLTDLVRAVANEN